jgi:hypothetical protein
LRTLSFVAMNIALFWQRNSSTTLLTGHSDLAGWWGLKPTLWSGEPALGVLDLVLRYMC